MIISRSSAIHADLIEVKRALKSAPKLSQPIESQVYANSMTMEQLTQVNTKARFEIIEFKAQLAKQQLSIQDMIAELTTQENSRNDLLVKLETLSSSLQFIQDLKIRESIKEPSFIPKKRIKEIEDEIQEKYAELNALAELNSQGRQELNKEIQELEEELAKIDYKYAKQLREKGYEEGLKADGLTNQDKAEMQEDFEADEQEKLDAYNEKYKTKMFQVLSQAERALSEVSEHQGLKVDGKFAEIRQSIYTLIRLAFRAVKSFFKVNDVYTNSINAGNQLERIAALEGLTEEVKHTILIQPQHEDIGKLTVTVQDVAEKVETSKLRRVASRKAAFVAGTLVSPFKLVGKVVAAVFGLFAEQQVPGINSNIDVRAAIASRLDANKANFVGTLGPDNDKGSLSMVTITGGRDPSLGSGSGSSSAFTLAKPL